MLHCERNENTTYILRYSETELACHVKVACARHCMGTVDASRFHWLCSIMLVVAKNFPDVSWGAVCAF